MSLVPTEPPSRATPLNRATLRALDGGGVELPTYEPAALRAGLVHIGVGPFHRAHQAAYLHRLAQRDARLGWSVTGLGLRSSRDRAELLAQDGLYTLLERDAGEETVRIVGVLGEYHCAVGRPHRAVAVLADPRTRVVTVTATAPSYRLPAQHDDLFDVLARALDERRRRGLAPFTVMSCDNLPRNGDTMRDRVVAAADGRSAALRRWVEHHAAFPNSLVDRITPPPDGAPRRHLRDRYGIADRVPVVTERASHWIVEDVAVGERPAWEEVGVRLVSDVRPFVDHKTRMLNGAHLALGFLGAGRWQWTHEAMAEPDLRATLDQMLTAEVQPGLPCTAGVDLAAYRSEVLCRIANPAIGDPLTRLRRRASTRMANYLVPSLEAALEDRRPTPVLASVVAAWISFLADAAAEVAAGARSVADLEEELADADAVGLLPLAATARDDVRPFLAAAPGFERIAGHPGLVRQLRRALTIEEDRHRAAS
jgi:fructuronate reductase/mannitol 2-dehydrogenase